MAQWLSLLLVWTALAQSPDNCFLGLSFLSEQTEPNETLIVNTYSELLSALGMGVTIPTWKKLAESKNPFALPDQKDTDLGGLQKNLRAFLAEQTAGSLSHEISYTNPKGETFTLPLWQMMVQPPNHNTHHRGELAAMFALMNVPHPEEEIVQYFLVKSGQRKE